MEDVKQVLINTLLIVKRLGSGNFAHKRALIYASIELAIILLNEMESENKQL